jgi:hypothetical protein
MLLNFLSLKVTCMIRAELCEVKSGRWNMVKTLWLWILMLLIYAFHIILLILHFVFASRLYLLIYVAFVGQYRNGHFDGFTLSTYINTENRFGMPSVVCRYVRINMDLARARKLGKFYSYSKFKILFIISWHSANTNVRTPSKEWRFSRKIL